MADRKHIHSLGRLQRAVMETVWALGAASVQQVRERLERNPPPAYTTVLSVMQKLEKAGWLRHRTEGRTYVYLPARSRAAEGARSLRDFIRRVFGGDPLRLVQHLLESGKLTDAELAELKRLIAHHEQGKQHDQFHA